MLRTKVRRRIERLKGRLHTVGLVGYCVDCTYSRTMYKGVIAYVMLFGYPFGSWFGSWIWRFDLLYCWLCLDLVHAMVWLLILNGMFRSDACSMIAYSLPMGGLMASEARMTR